MNLVKIVLLFMGVAFFTTAVAQNHVIDSLENALAKHPRMDTERVDIMANLGLKLYSRDAKRAEAYGRQALELATKLNYRKGEGNSLWLIGLSIKQRNKEESLGYFKKALDLAEQSGNKVAICGCLLNCWEILKEIDDINKYDDYLNRALDIARSINNDNFVSRALYCLSQRNMTKGDYILASEQLHQIIHITNKNGDKKMLASAYNQLGIIHLRQGDEYKALDYFLAGIKIDEEVNYKPGMFSKYMSVGEVQSNQKEYESALESIRRALQIAEEIKDSTKISIGLAGMGEVYLRMNNPEALRCLQEALEIQGDNSLNSKINILTNIGIFYTKQGTFELARKNLDEAMALAEKKNLRFACCQIYMRMGDLYSAQGQHGQAIAYVRKGLDWAKEIGFLESQRDGYKQLSELNAATGDYKNAYQNQAQYKIVNDSIFNDKKTRGLALLESSYQFEKERQAYEMEKANHQLEIENQQHVILFLIIATLLVLVLLFILYWWNKLKKRVLALEIENVNQELEYSQKEMASATLKLIQNSESDAYCVKSLENIRNNTTKEGEGNVRSLINYYKNKSIYSNWDEFETLFIKVNGTFYEKLNERFASLTPNERKLCVFLRLNMSNKDIAQITFQSEEALKKARLRLRKKLDLDHDVNLASFIQGL